MVDVKKAPWDTTDEYFGVDTPILYDPVNANRDYTGRLVFIRTDKEVKDKLLAGKGLDWDSVMPTAGMSVFLYPERKPAGVNTDHETVLFYHVPEGIKLMSTTSSEYRDFMEWRSGMDPRPMGIDLRQFGGYHGMIGPSSDGAGTLIQLHDREIFRQGLIYPTERQAVVESVVRRRADVPDQVLSEIYHDPYSNDLESEYTNPGYDYTITLTAKAFAKNPEEAFEVALDYAKKQGMPGFECKVTNYTTEESTLMNTGVFQDAVSQASGQKEVADLSNITGVVFAHNKVLFGHGDRVGEYDADLKQQVFCTNLPADSLPDPSIIAMTLGVNHNPHGGDDASLQVIGELETGDTEERPFLEPLIDKFVEEKVKAGWMLRVEREEVDPEDLDEDEKETDYHKVVDSEGRTIKRWFVSGAEAQDWADEQMKLLGIPLKPTLQFHDIDGQSFCGFQVFSNPEQTGFNVYGMKDLDGIINLIELPGKSLNLSADELKRVLGEQTADTVLTQDPSLNFTEPSSWEFKLQGEKSLVFDRFPITMTETATEIKASFSWPENLPNNYVYIQGKNGAGEVVLQAPFHAAELKDALGEGAARKLLEDPFCEVTDLDVPCDPVNLVLGEAESKASVGRLEATRFVNCRPVDGYLKIDAFTKSGKWLFGEMYQDGELAAIYGQDLADQLLANNGGSYSDLNMQITPAMLNEDPEEEQTVVPEA